MKRVTKSLKVVESESKTMPIGKLKVLSKRLSKLNGQVIIRIMDLKKSSIACLAVLESVSAFL